MGKAIVGVVAVFVAIIGLTVLFGSWYTVEQGERAVLLTNGKLTSVEGPGLHFKTPWFQSVRELSTRQQVLYWNCYEGGECPEGNRFQMQSYSKDQQAADLRVTINFRVPEGDIGEVYSRYGTVENLGDQTVARFAPEAIKEVFGQYTATGVVQQRAAFNASAEAAVRDAVKGYPLLVDSVQVENIDFSTAYEQAIEARMQAEVAVAQQNQLLAKEKVSAEIAVTQAKALSDSKKLQADAEAYSTQVKGEAEAKAIKLRADALAANAALVELTKAERWDGKLPTTVLPNGTVPFIDAAGGVP